MPAESDRLTVPAPMHEWPLLRLALSARTYNALIRAGIHTLGDLDGRCPATFAQDLKNFGMTSALELENRLRNAIGAPHVSAAGPPPTAVPSTVMAWLRAQVPAKHLGPVIRHEADRHTLARIAAEMDRSPERVRQHAVHGMRKARVALAHSATWAAWCEAALAAIEQLSIVSEEGLYELLAADHGWGLPAPAGELAALRGLLALHPAIKVLLADDVYAFCTDAEHALRVLDGLAALPDAERAERHAALAPPYAAAAAGDAARLLPRRSALRASGRRQAVRNRAREAYQHGRPTSPTARLLPLGAHETDPPASAPVPASPPQALGVLAEIAEQARAVKLSHRFAALSDRRDADEAACWVPAGRAIAVGGYQLPDGMLYVGGKLPAILHPDAPEPALIDPRLPIDATSPAAVDAPLPPGPLSYARLEPSDRAAYLAWLAEGRQDPGAPLAFCLLYLFGLERRLLPRLQFGGKPGELRAIAAELLRLYAHYGHEPAFGGRACALLLLAQAKLAERLPLPREAPPRRPGDAPVAVQLGLALSARFDLGLPASWALAWLEHDLAGRLRTPAIRCPEEFRRLFLARYHRTFADGLRVAPGDRLLEVTYDPASPSFGGPVRLRTELREVAAEPALARLKAFADVCCAELDAFSHQLGKAQDANAAQAARALLPPILLAGDRPPALEALLAPIEMGFGDGRVAHFLIPQDRLLETFGGAEAEAMTATEALTAIKTLAMWDVGLEPDPRFGGAAFGWRGWAVAFRLPHGAPEGPSPAHEAAMTVLQVAAAVAGAKVASAAAARQVMYCFAEAAPGCTPAERARLAAYAASLEVGPRIPPKKLRPLLATLSHAQRQAGWAFARGLVMAVATADKAEIRLLEGFADAFGQPRRRLYDDRLGMPAPAEAAASPVRLDAAAVQRKLRETAAVSALLANVFADQEPATDARATWGLDAAHMRLLAHFAGHEAIPRAAFTGLAVEAGLLADGALDTINEAALEACGQPAVEGDDPLVVDPLVIRALLG